MSTISYKCPNCGGDLRFDPKTQKFQCEYCVSFFSEKELEEANPQAEETPGEESAADGKRKPETAQEQAENSGNAVVYSCPSCGAEVITDETTAATFCYYCHNPVILKGRLEGDYLPNLVLPFRVDRKEAEQAFLEYVHKKKFVPRAFFHKSQIEKITGVYFPYWVCDCRTNGEMSAKATKVRVWRTGDTEFTETRIYEVERSGQMGFSDITKNALKKAAGELVEGVQPFPMEECKEFSMGYLSGFQAEKRDLEKEKFQTLIEEEVAGYSRKMLRESVSGYATVTPKDTKIRMEQMDWNYVLLPVWTLTYRGKDNQVYYYAMNGFTRKVCGKLPVDYRKVWILFLAVFFPVLILGLLGGYLL